MPPPAAPPTTLRQTIASMPAVFNAQTAGELKAVIQYDVCGNDPGQYHTLIAGGTCTAYEGRHPSPTLTIHTPSDVWLRISRGDLDGVAALLQGLYTADGDLSLLTRMSALFAAPEPSAGISA